MNSEKDNVELLGSPTTTNENTSSVANPSTSTEVLGAPTGAGTNPVDSTINQTASTSTNTVSNEVANSAAPSHISPLVAKPTISGTTANSPRINPSDTMASYTSHAPQTPLHVEKTKDEISNNGGSVAPPIKVDDSTTQPKGKPLNPIVLIIVFVIILGTVILLPYSKDLFGNIFSNDIATDEEKVTNGSLVCTLENTDDDNNSFEYTETYTFTNSEVDTLEHEELIQGDADFLNERNDRCQLLKQNASSIEGVEINCDLNTSNMVETQKFNLARVDFDQLSTAFMEAGGVYPNAEAGDSYTEVQHSMEIAGYTCEVK